MELNYNGVKTQLRIKRALQIYQELWLGMWSAIPVVSLLIVPVSGFRPLRGR